jgi:hypothetical protein
MLVQTTFDFTIHEKENNADSQAHLEVNTEKWMHHCKIIYEAMKRGKKVGNEDPRVWDESIKNYRRIGHLPRRIADIKKYLEGTGIEVKDDWKNGFKYYYL